MGDTPGLARAAPRRLLEVDAGPDVEIWCGATDVAADESVLSADERARAARFRFARDRRRWVAARVLLRELLGESLGVNPRELLFRYSEYGKPSLDPEFGVKFNLSHSGDLAVCSVSRSREIGIDVEQIRSIENLDAVFAEISGPGEQQVFERLPDGDKLRAFFHSWTVKEACVKAAKKGLSMPVRGIEVLGSRLDEGVRCGAESWKVLTFCPQAGYVAAIAVECPKNFFCD